MYASNVGAMECTDTDFTFGIKHSVNQHKGLGNGYSHGAYTTVGSLVQRGKVKGGMLTQMSDFAVYSRDLCHLLPPFPRRCQPGVHAIRQGIEGRVRRVRVQIRSK